MECPSLPPGSRLPRLRPKTRLHPSAYFRASDVRLLADPLPFMAGRPLHPSAPIQGTVRRARSRRPASPDPRVSTSASRRRGGCMSGSRGLGLCLGSCCPLFFCESRNNKAIIWSQIGPVPPIGFWDFWYRLETGGGFALAPPVSASQVPQVARSWCVFL